MQSSPHAKYVGAWVGGWEFLFPAPPPVPLQRDMWIPDSDLHGGSLTSGEKNFLLTVYACATLHPKAVQYGVTQALQCGIT